MQNITGKDSRSCMPDAFTCLHVMLKIIYAGIIGLDLATLFELHIYVVEYMK